MKKVFVILLALSLLCGFAACEKEEKGIAIVNDLGVDLENIYIVRAGAEDWGEPLIGYLDAGVGAFVYLGNSLGGREFTVDLRAVDVEGDAYEFSNVYMMDGDSCSLQFAEGEVIAYVDVHGRNVGSWIIAEDEPEMDVVGIWEYDAYYIYLILDEDDSYAEVSAEDGHVIDEGKYTVDGESLILTSGYGDPERTMSIYEDLLVDADGDSLSYAGSKDGKLYNEILGLISSANMAYFDMMGFGANYSLDEGSVLMDNAVYVFAQDGLYYDSVPALVSISLDSYNDTQDGFVEIEFTKTVYIDRDDYPEFMFYNDFDIGMTHKLFDYYTGHFLPDSAVYGNTSRGDNYFYYEYESQDRTICVDYNYSTEWTRHEDDSYTFEQQNFIRMPADYDGIIYGHLEAYPDYQSCVDAREYPVELISPMDDSDAENALLCCVNSLG